MIRYPITRARLLALIDEEAPTWRQRAAERTETFRQLGRYEESTPFWSEVKAVFMRLQGDGKCAYCERKLESEEYGKGEQDVEHFRPKGNVKPWKPSKELAALPLTPPPGEKKGYYLLPYNPLNYAAACKPCNSALKSDRFPIAGAYRLDKEDPARMQDEKAYLIYPIGSIDLDPAKMIEFHGLSPRPLAASGFERDRALATIDFFQLGNPIARKNLFRDRALVVVAVFRLLEQTQTGDATARKQASDKLKKALSPRLSHLNCAQSFVRLYHADPEAAKAIHTKALELALSLS
jgi:hypothetical protein